MAWEKFYINCEKLYGIDETEEDLCILYDLNIPPHGGIRREWTTTGMKHGTAKILFVEYQMEDDDPDGVWEAYGMKAESEYSFTVNAENTDPEKLFVYTVYRDGSLRGGFEIDTENAEGILVFAEPREIEAEVLMRVAAAAKNSFWNSDTVVELLKHEILKGAGALCLAFFRL